MALTKIADAGLKKPASDLQDNEKVVLGTGNDLEIYHDSNNSLIDNNTGNLYINSAGDIYLCPKDNEAGVYIRGDGAVELYFDNSKKIETFTWGAQSYGNIAFRDSDKAYFGTSNDLVIEHDSNHSYISHNGQGDLFVQTDGLFAVQKYATTERLINANADGNVELFYNGNKKLETTDNGITLTGWIYIPDSDGSTDNMIRLGAGADLKIYHNGTNSIIDDAGAGALIIRTDNALDIKDSDNVMMAAFNKDSDVKLYHDGSVKLETTSYGLLHHGGHKADGTGYFKVNDDGDFYAGNDEDLKIYHDGSNTFIDNSTGTLRVRGSNIRICDTSNNTFFSGESAGSKVYHNDAVKLTTSTTGVTVSGVCDATCFTGDSGTSYGYTEISSSNATVTTTYSQVDSNHEWDLPGAGVYKLEASVRVRIDDVSGFIKARYSGSAGDGPPLMLFEADDSDTMYNTNAHIMWVYTATGADTVDLQFASSATSTGFSIQNDINGRAFMLWTRIG